MLISQLYRAHASCMRHQRQSAWQQCSNLRSCSSSLRWTARTVCTARSDAEQAMEAESRAEARRKRRQANTPTEDTLVVDPADTVMTTDETRIQPTTETPERQQARALLNRKSDVIVKLATAGTHINEAIREHRHEIDDLLLSTLEKRIDAASGVEEEKNAVQGLFLLWRRLRAERSRMEATPAQRLLDDALQVMDPDSGLSLQDRTQDTTVLLRRAFSAPGSRPIDIFGVAAAIAEGQEVAPEELLNEFVPREAFVAETSALLDSVMQEQRDIERAWKAGNAKEHQEAAGNLVKERRLAILQIQEIVGLAKTLRL